MQPPTLISKSVGKIELKWVSAGANIQYEIVMLDGEKELFKTTTKDLTRNLKTVDGVEIYKIKIRALNQCGYGPLSDELLVNLSKGAPDKMNTVRQTKPSGECSVKLLWDKPKSNNSPITNYIISI